MTPYNSIRDLWLSKITDFDFGSMLETEINDLFDKYLLASIPKFRLCGQNLNDRDDTLRQFNITLSLDEQEILATLSAIEWLSHQILHQQLLKQNLGSKDFSIFSPANQLKEMMSLKRELTNDVNSLITFYHYLNWGG
jgi:hypothetical protein